MFSPEESPRVQFGLQTNVLSRSDNTIRVASRFFLIQTIRNQCTPLPSTRENFGLYYKTERHKRGVNTKCNSRRLTPSMYNQSLNHTIRMLVSNGGPLDPCPSQTLYPCTSTHSSTPSLGFPRFQSPPPGTRNRGRNRWTAGL